MTWQRAIVGLFLLALAVLNVLGWLAERHERHIEIDHRQCPRCDQRLPDKTPTKEQLGPTLLVIFLTAIVLFVATLHAGGFW